MKIVIDISKDRYDEIMSMDWKNGRRFFDEEIRAIHDGKALEKSSSSEKPNKWIPVETALPEWGVSVLVYAERNAYDDKGQFRRKVIDIGWQCGGDWHIDGCNGVVGIAWMPLPTPPNKSEIQTGEERSDKE